MASGRTHSIATMLSAMCGVLQVPTNDAGAAWIVGSLYGLLSTPDLDQIEEVGEKIGGYYGQAVIRDTFGGGKIGAIIEYTWWVYWQPYADFIPHRNWKSHLPPFGTIGRLVYGFPFIVFFFFFLHNDFGYFLIALLSSDILHWVMDWKIWKSGLFKPLNLFKQ